MQGNVRTGPGIRRRREVIGVCLARHLEHAKRHLLRHRRLRREPLGLSPALHHLLCVLVPGLHLFLHVKLCVKHEECVGERCGCLRGESWVVQCLNQWGHIVSTQHGAQHLYGILLRDQRRRRLSLHHRCQERRLHIGCVINPGRHTVLEEVQCELAFVCWGFLEQLDDVRREFGAQWQWDKTLCTALSHVCIILHLEGGGKETGQSGGRLHGASQGSARAAYCSTTRDACGNGHESLRGSGRPQGPKQTC
mmetsp:Transcript_109900/g.164365  ORF Transcript_109900/g.164365 Transcript_109900/m.164365 type:complete len:251 (+) Transcript_109900:490-1242(+)